MSKPNGISYGVRSEDEGSDMDVSSDDEGLSICQPLPNHFQEQLQIPHGTTEQGQLQNASLGQLQPLSSTSHTEFSASRLTTNTNCWTTFVDRVAQHQSSTATSDEASDTESTSSFHTAPNSLADLTLDDDQNVDMDRQQPPNIIHELVSEQDKLTQELEHISREEKRIADLIEASKAKLEAIRVRQLELQVRKSIQKNRKAVTTPAKSKKGKEKAPIDVAYRSCSSSDEDDIQQPPRKAKAIADIDSGRPERQPVKTSARVELDAEYVEEDGEIKTEEDEMKPADTNEHRTYRYISTQEAARSSMPASNLPNIISLSKQNKQALQIIKRSQKVGHTSVGQMKMFLCDLYDKFLEDGKLTSVQKVHYRDLVKKVSQYHVLGDNHIPGKITPKKAKKLGQKTRPEPRCMLPDEYYGHPEKLDFNNLKVDKNKLLDALRCSQIETPVIVTQARRLLSKKPTNVKLSDFNGVIGADGQFVDQEELAASLGVKKLNRLISLYREISSEQNRRHVASTVPMLNAQRTRNEYLMAQRQLEESVVRETGTMSPEPSTVENPLVSDNSTAALNSVVVSLAPSSRDLNAKPITTITYVPNETSFIRSILPGGKNPSSSNQQPKAAKKPKAIQRPKLPPQPKASNIKFNGKSKALPPMKKPTKASVTIPKNPSPLKLYDNSSSSATNTSSSSTLSTNINQQPLSAPQTLQLEQPQQSKSSTFQPYRSALDSLGVTHSADVKPMKTGVLCRAESNGGVCNDKSCRDMHFTDFMSK